jgi:hypothetical protein
VIVGSIGNQNHEGRAMTRQELAAKLAHLDPGGTLVGDENTLRQVFAAPTLTSDIETEISGFAQGFQCQFFWHELGGAAPRFEKEEVS